MQKLKGRFTHHGAFWIATSAVASRVGLTRLTNKFYAVWLETTLDMFNRSGLQSLRNALSILENEIKWNQ